MVKRSDILLLRAAATPRELFNMTADARIIYEFGPFRLHPTESRLFRDGQRVKLQPKTFDILVVVVSRAPDVVLWDELREKIWKVQNVTQKNILTQVGILKKALIVDGKSYLQVIKARGVQLTAVPRRKERPTSVSNHDPDRTVSPPFTVDCHQFVPTAAVINEQDAFDGRHQRTAWGQYLRLEYPEGALCAFSDGRAVWHLTNRVEFASLCRFAEWRTLQYRHAREGIHPICVRTADLLSSIKGPSAHASAALGKMPYTFMVVSLQGHGWGIDELPVALQILTSPRVLQVSRDPQAYFSGELEAAYLREGLKHPDIHVFGVGLRHGYACWSGISLYDPTGDDALVTAVSEYEIVLQSLWLRASSVRKHIEQHTPRTGCSAETTLLRDGLASLEAVGANDDSQRRLMIEAVLKTSRLREVVSEAIQYIDHIANAEQPK